MVCFAKLPAVKKDTILAAARNFFGYSYFVTALFKGVSNIETCNYRLLSTSRKELWKFVIFCYLSIRTKFAQKFFERLLDFSQQYHSGTWTEITQIFLGEHKVKTPEQQFLCVILSFFIHLRWPWLSLFCVDAVEAI